MIYHKIGQYLHLLIQPLERKLSYCEIVFSSGGSWFEKAQDRGKTHLLEHCQAGRLKDMNFKEFQDFQFSQNIMLNAFTSSLTMGVDCEGFFQDAELMLEKVLEIAFSPTFDQEILDQEKEIVLREISERRGDPNYRLYYHTMNQVFEKDSFDTHEVLGSPQRVAETSLEDFQRLHLENLKRSHALIMVSGGGISQKKVISKVEDFFTQNSEIYNVLNRQDAKKDEINFMVKADFREFKNLAVVHQLGHSHGEISVYIPIEISYANHAVRRIFSELFLSFHGKLYDILRNKEGLIYSMSSNYHNHMQSLTLNFSCEIDKIFRILEIIKEFLSDFQQNFEEKKFFQVRDIVRKKTQISSDNLNGSVNFCSNSLLNYAIPDNLENFSKRITEATKEELQSFFKSVFKGWEKRRVVLVSNNRKIVDLVNSKKLP